MNVVGKTSNLLLGALQAEDVAIVRPLLEPVTLNVRDSAEKADEPISWVYFPDHGIISVVAQSGPDQQIEAGLIGREGMSGLSVLLGSDRSPHEVYVQVAGAGHRIARDALRATLVERPGLQVVFLRYAQSFAVQTAHTALANGAAKIEERLSRWLLMAHDRIDGPQLPLTHEFMALMLGVRRAGVTDALHRLEGLALIRSTRGLVTILDREGLEVNAGAFYGGPEREYARLMGISISTGR